MPRLLILSCSQRKRTGSGYLPAIERYDGPAFRVLRKYNKVVGACPPTTFVLSAEYGLIPADHPVRNYNRRMTPRRAGELRKEVTAKLEQILQGGSGPTYNDVMICAGRIYRQTLANNRFKDGFIRFTGGSIGKQVADLYVWLHGEPPPTPEFERKPAKPVVFRGVEIRSTREQVLALAGEHIANDSQGARRYQSWYVQAGKHRVAHKWLVNKLTGIPVSEFRTLDARRVLAQLGVEVRRV